MTLLEGAIILVAGIAAGIINVVAGAGTLITFPTLLALGIPPITANVSNTVGLVPGSIAGAHGYRRELPVAMAARGLDSRVLGRRWGRRRVASARSARGSLLGSRSISAVARRRALGRSASSGAARSAEGAGRLHHRYPADHVWSRTRHPRPAAERRPPKRGNDYECQEGSETKLSGRC